MHLFSSLWEEYDCHGHRQNGYLPPIMEREGRSQPSWPQVDRMPYSYCGEREGRLTMWGRQKSPWSPACCSDLCRPPIAAPLEVLHSHRKKQSQAKKVQTSSHGRKKSKEERHTQNQVGPAGDGMVRGSMLLASADARLPMGDPDKRHSSNSPTIAPVPNRDE